MIGGKKGIVLLLIIAVLANTLPRWIHFGSVCGRKVYYVGQALSFVLILVAGKIEEGKKDEIVKIAYDATLWLAISNLLDEMFFSPTDFGWNELIFSIGMVTWTIYRLVKWQRTSTMKTP